MSPWKSYQSFMRKFSAVLELLDIFAQGTASTKLI